VGFAAGVAVSLAAPSALAYNPKTHSEIVSQSWQIMRAAADPNFIAEAGFASPPGGAALNDPGPCASGTDNRCGATVSPQAWQTFIAKMSSTRQHLNAAVSGEDLNRSFPPKRLDQYPDPL